MGKENSGTMILIALLVVTATAISVVVVLIAVVVISIGRAAVVRRCLAVGIVHAGAISAPVVAAESRHGVLGIIGISRIAISLVVKIVIGSIVIAVIRGAVLHMIGIIVCTDIVIEVIVRIVVETPIMVGKPCDRHKREESAQQAGGECT